MKRPILILAAVLALVFAGAAFAQSPQNTTAPGPTQQQEPGLTNNNLPNPGNPQTAVGNQTQPVEEHGTAEGTATESMHQEQAPAAPAPTTTTTTTTTTPSTDTSTTTGTTTSTTDTTATGTGAYAGSADTTTSTTNALPKTASDLPTVALIGLLALGAAFVLRYSRRNA